MLEFSGGLFGVLVSHVDMSLLVFGSKKEMFRSDSIIIIGVAVYLQPTFKSCFFSNMSLEM